MSEPVQSSVIVDPAGRPARQAAGSCPRCGSGKDKRVKSSGFGVPHPVCSQCGYEWMGEVFHE